MNKGRYYVFVIFALLLPLLVCSCAASSGTTSSKPAATTTAPAVEEKPTITIPPPAAKQDLPVIQFTINPATITAGGSATLAWTVTNATSVAIDHGVGNVPLTGTKAVTPTAPTIYKLTASNAAGVAKPATVSVIVNAAASTPAAPKK